MKPAARGAALGERLASTLRAVSRRRLTAVGVVVAAASVVAAPSGSRALRATIAPCAPTGLRVTLDELPGTAGLGRVDYRLRLGLRVSPPCYVAGFPTMTFLDRHGRHLPLRVRHMGSGAIGRVEVTRAAAAESTVRLAPCSGRNDAPIAAAARVVVPPSRATLVVSLRPATSICGPIARVSAITSLPVGTHRRQGASWIAEKLETGLGSSRRPPRAGLRRHFGRGARARSAIRSLST